ncbi:MAG: hypothetical protein HOH20_10185 [Rhodospirillaceae bacterium]|mgnify:FL=1|jgi:hypothetical protein|nr:hypothetical protein [Rhodospirillaceae bacterium]MBT5564138.1 hypothetical protein [Rhodospirillaceae bacterium]MBT6089933.1 hypothetical protein [Rhodospirillaceae bacterium]
MAGNSIIGLILFVLGTITPPLAVLLFIDRKPNAIPILMPLVILTQLVWSVWCVLFIALSSYTTGWGIFESLAVLIFLMPTLTLGIFFLVLHRLGYSLDSNCLGMNLWGIGGLLLLIACVANFGVFALNQTFEEFKGMIGLIFASFLAGGDDWITSATFLAPIFVLVVWVGLSAKSLWNAD